MGAKGTEGQEAPNHRSRKATQCLDAHTHHGVVHGGGEGQLGHGKGGLGFSGVPGTLTSTQLQPPEDCPGPGHEPPGINRQQPANWCGIPGPHNVNSQDIFISSGLNPSPPAQLRGVTPHQTRHTYRITG